MYIYGDNISTTELRIMNYTVMSAYGMKWKQLSNGNYVAIDRGADSDIYEANITTNGTETYINNILTQLDIVESSASGTLTTSGYAGNEHIFGENIDYSTATTVAITNIKARKSNTFKGWQLDLTLKALSPAFEAGSSLPVFSGACINYKYIGTKEYDLIYNESYYGDFTYSNHTGEGGVFKGTFTFTDTELRLLSEWIRANRDTAFSLTELNGVAYPWGPTISLPHNAKIIDIRQLQKFGLDNWLVELTIVPNF